MTVTYEQALWLKEKGFDEISRKYYLPRNPLMTKDDLTVSLKENKDSDNFNHPSYAWLCLAPEQHEVIEWLRVKHEIWVSVDIDINGMYKKIIRKYNSKDRAWEVKYATSISEKYHTPQEAYSAAFDYIRTNNLI
jgi:hypothetical protein